MGLEILSAPRIRAIDDTGSPVPLAKLYCYAAGSSSVLQNTYADSGQVTPNANPIVADSAGLFGAIFMLPLAYNFILKSNDGGTTYWSQDNVAGPNYNALLDSTWQLKDNLDPTKILKFQLSSITTATTRTITAIDSDMEMGHAGEYTPTLTNTANVAASTAYISNYVRTGNYVVVAFRVDIDPTLAAPTVTELQMTLPIASDFTLATDACGGFAFGGISGQSGRIEADTASNKVRLLYLASNAANADAGGSFIYRIR